jgi:RNA polymerase sigma-70 factor (ECF subfamily)
MVRDPALAEDLAQEVFLKAFRSLDSFDPERKFSSWLFKIAHNATVDQLRRRGVATEPLEGGWHEEEGGPVRQIADPAAETPEAARQRGDLRRALEASIAGLRPVYREVIVLRFQEELSYEEIAEVTGLPLGTVKTFIHRARKELADTLRGQGWSPERAAGSKLRGPAGRKAGWRGTR